MIQAQVNNAETHKEMVKALNKEMMALQCQILDVATPDDLVSQLKKQSEVYVDMLHCVCINLSRLCVGWRKRWMN